MEFKKIIIVLSITIAICIGILFGSSYAWYAYKNAEANIEGSTIKEIPTEYNERPKGSFSNRVYL